MKTKALLWLYALLIVTLLFIDRITKCIALACFSSRCIYNQYLSFELVFNRGISWSLLHATSDWLFAAVSISIACITVLLAVISFFRWRDQRVILGELLVLSGSISNIADRVLYHGVIDFIAFSYNGFAWPLFNIADVCIVVGVIMMLIEQYKEL